MAVASGVIRSTLNPNAPPFIPSSFQRVQDFAPKSFVGYLIHQHPEAIDGGEEEENIAALLPETFEVEEFSGLLEEAALFHAAEQKEVYGQYGGPNQEKPRLDMTQSLALRSPSGASWSAMEQRKYWEQPPAHELQNRQFRDYSPATMINFGLPMMKQ